MKFTAPQTEKFCRHCQRMLPVEKFFVRHEREHRYGKYQSGCKECRIANVREKREKALKPKQIPLPATERVCRGCQQTLPLDSFPWDSARPWTKESRCWECDRERGRRYVQAHKEERGEYNRQYYRRDPESCLKRARASVAKKPEHYKQWSQAYKASNKVKNKLYMSRRRARAMGNGGSWTPEDWERVKAQHDWRCVACGLQELTDGIKLSFDHIIPLVLGGYNFISNCQPLCVSCNAAKNAKFIDYRTDPYGLKKGTQ